MQKLLGLPVKPLKSCKSEHSEMAMQAYRLFTDKRGAYLEAVARRHLGLTNGARCFSYGNFENMCCEYRKWCDSNLNIAKAVCYTTNPTYLELLPYRCQA